MIFGEAADARTIDDLERKFCFHFPDEFRSLYTTYDGYGVTYDTKPGEIYWDFRPIGDLEAFVKQYVAHGAAGRAPFSACKLFAAAR